MRLRQIPKGQWPSFLAGFSRQHSGWLSSLVATQSAVGAPECLAADLPLEDIELRDAGITISLGADAASVSHVIEMPSELMAEETAEGVQSGLVIKSPAGAKSHLSFRSPIAPELVDGAPLS
jgi:hypothetical protein